MTTGIVGILARRRNYATTGRSDSFAAPNCFVMRLAIINYNTVTRRISRFGKNFFTRRLLSCCGRGLRSERITGFTMLVLIFVDSPTGLFRMAVFLPFLTNATQEGLDMIQESL